MRGPVPKDPKIRQRVNKHSTAATLTLVTDGKPRRRPPLPERAEGETWHTRTQAWWRKLWLSPMAQEYLDVDIEALYRLAWLIERFWVKPSTQLANEIAREQTAFGLTPIDRRRLMWEIRREEEANKPRRPEAPTGPEDDPRKILEFPA